MGSSMAWRGFGTFILKIAMCHYLLMELLAEYSLVDCFILTITIPEKEPSDKIPTNSILFWSLKKYQFQRIMNLVASLIYMLVVQ
jgi:hypothetical protein